MQGLHPQSVHVMHRAPPTIEPTAPQSGHGLDIMPLAQGPTGAAGRASPAPSPSATARVWSSFAGNVSSHMLPTVDMYKCAPVMSEKMDGARFAEMVGSIPAAEWVVYILRSVPRPMRTYAGVTNDLAKRIRQHNGELAGGARATLSTRPWEPCAVVRGFGDDKSLAMRFEWFCKAKHYPAGRVPGNTGAQRRMVLLQHARSKCQDRGRDVRVCVRDDMAAAAAAAHGPPPETASGPPAIVIDVDRAQKTDARQ